MRTDEFYNRYWTDFFGWCPSRASLWRMGKDLFLHYLRASALVIDFGCGDCQRYGDLILSSCMRYVGLDASETAILRCLEKGPNVIVRTPHNSLIIHATWCSASGQDIPSQVMSLLELLVLVSGAKWPRPFRTNVSY